ncbi:hypothetical protein SERLA73DRAFT_177903 [Serpula lacrymans var. lacrymans S7.3]|uniref:Thioredoxin domain-containing protein n=2 Tax=Serpula lacrymans var. lacrymans TaxID=341189 RepID=F8PPX5_SERL3|nr:uncharacterized protein SERLADRAFT_461745 [Serpula lacrymans var. lacrymans S7.9]EGO02129.1 hypothetical protein SERLA73DRAFT_177903 [Serpula lacrymans var. lacrymans S7.3]EGO27753.1 hypothetical protein SERLADRAFT_461745 [Serpula lacrymans var. lacrymans S7.9]
MKALALLSAFFITSAHAQYFSAGWAPGQPVNYNDEQSEVSDSGPQATSTLSAEKAAPTSIKQALIDNVLGSSTISTLSSLVGVNITERFNPSVLWDERIPLITDENYGDIIVNEELTEEEEEDRVWFLIITVTTGQPDGVSMFVDKVFDATYNLTQGLGDLPHVRFGRIDYLNVTSITTKWAVWSAPFLVVLKDRGQTLRFYKAGQIRLTDEILHAFLKEEGWKQKDPWKSAYGPGGEREYILDYLAIVFTKVYNVVVIVPKWLLYIVTGGLASLIVNWLHRDRKPANPSANVHQPRTVPTNRAEPAAAPAASNPASGGQRSGESAAKRRKGKK